MAIKIPPDKECGFTFTPLYPKIHDLGEQIVKSSTPICEQTGFSCKSAGYGV
jgi:hypothetical protein